MITIAVAMLSIPGCSTTKHVVEVAKLSAANEVLIYQNGRPVVKCEIARGSVEERSVAAWLRSHPDGWHTDIINYAPARQVKGTDFTLNFHPALCVLNYQTGEGDWKQVSRPIRSEDPTPGVFGDPRRPAGSAD